MKRSILLIVLIAFIGSVHGRTIPISFQKDAIKIDYSSLEKAVSIDRIGHNVTLQNKRGIDDVGTQLNIVLQCYNGKINYFNCTGLALDSIL